MSKVQVVDNSNLTVESFEEELHMRRLVWRWREVDQGWTVLEIDLNATHNCCAPTCGLGEEEDFKASLGAGDVGNLLIPWWARWRQQGLPSLLPYNKLKEERRTKNLKEDDVCVFQCENKVKSMLCCVKEVEETVDGLGRTATIGYKVRCRDSFTRATPDVAIQKLMLLVPGEKVTGEAQEMMEYEAWTEG